jgi:hypothetical protein
MMRVICVLAVLVTVMSGPLVAEDRHNYKMKLRLKTGFGWFWDHCPKAGKVVSLNVEYPRIQGRFCG